MFAVLQILTITSLKFWIDVADPDPEEAASETPVIAIGCPTLRARELGILAV